MDGSVTGFGEPSVAASGLSDAGLRWKVDDEGTDILMEDASMFVGVIAYAG